MASTLLQVLRFSKGELEFLTSCLQEEYVKAHATLREVRDTLSSMQRITNMLERISGKEESRFKELLESYPGIEELKRSIYQTSNEIVSTRQLLQEIKRAHQSAPIRPIAQADGDYWSRITHLYGAVILGRLRPWIRDKVVIDLRENLHIYWGGEDNPLGPGHGHCVFSPQQLLFRRNPKQQ